MSYCLNPNCTKPNQQNSISFCINCGTKLLLKERYRPINFLGAGGMGRNFLAIDEDTPLKRQCVIKQFFPAPNIANNQAAFQKAVELFNREAETLDKLGDECEQIPRLLAFLEQDKNLYFVQEYIEGKNLLKILQQEGNWQEEKIRHLLNKLLPVLKFIHQQDVIHRDIKPENIMYRQDNEFVLIDFGISRELRNTVMSMGTIVGTIGYAPPEQMIYGKVYPASDIYALGATCIHLLTGISPDRLFNPLENRWLWQEVLASNGIFISRELEEILEKMLKKEVGERWQSVDEILPILKRNPTQNYSPSPTPKSTTKQQNNFCSVVGIDLGITKSIIAKTEAGKPVVIPNKNGFYSTPTVVAFSENGNCLIGEAAQRQALRNPLNTFDSLMWFIGCKYDEVVEKVKQVSYQVLPDNKGGVLINCPVLGKQFTPEEILAYFLHKLVKDGSYYLEEEIKQVVITVPAYFNDIQRYAVQKVGNLAGLEVLRIICHPAAAALAYGLEKTNDETILIFDIGGGQCSVSILVIGNDVFEVLSYSGDNQLGGKDFDEKIVEWLIQNFKQIEGIDLSEDIQALARLREAAEKAKIELSSVSETEIYLPWIKTSSSGGKNLEVTLSSSEIEQMWDELINCCCVLVKNALRDAKLDGENVDNLILIGGSTRIPAIQKSLKQLLGKKPTSRIYSDKTVALGASIQGGVLAGEIKDILLLDVTSMSLGVETSEGVMTKILPSNTTIPTKKSKVFTTAVDEQTSVKIHILQGEQQMAEDNKSLGILCLDKISSAPRGEAQIEVTFDINANSILNVAAKDKGSGKEASITINSDSTLSEDEIEKQRPFLLSFPDEVSTEN
ncbi:MAG: molecular chaperone DnaK [Cyanobacteriota bacterium]|nr:molecular chaperone DnaK [Cyanobacteriota bacterium]